MVMNSLLLNVLFGALMLVRVTASPVTQTISATNRNGNYVVNTLVGNGEFDYDIQNSIYHLTLNKFYGAEDSAYGETWDYASNYIETAQKNYLVVLSAYDFDVTFTYTDTNDDDRLDNVSGAISSSENGFTYFAIYQDTPSSWVYLGDDNGNSTQYLTTFKIEYTGFLSNEVYYYYNVSWIETLYTGNAQSDNNSAMSSYSAGGLLQSNGYFEVNIPYFRQQGYVPNGVDCEYLNIDLYIIDAIGYSSGYTAGTQTGYTQGYTAGESAGYSSGFATGQQSGYNTGFIDGSNTSTTFLGLLSAVADTPLYFLKNLFNVELFGVNVYVIFASIITLLVAWTIFKKVWK